MSVIRIVFGFLVACLAAGMTQTLFAIPPNDMIAQPELVTGGAILALLAATQVAIFALPFAALVIAVTEWNAMRSWIVHALAGIAVAMTGYIVHVSTEMPDRTILNDYAFRAFLTCGFVAGFTYWLAAGRKAGAWWGRSKMGTVTP